MATILLQLAGTALGGFLGPVGGALGSAAGAIAGYALDRALINGTRRIEGPRLTGARALSGEEGAPIPRLYGTARLGGLLIWGTRFEEASTTRRQGGKGMKTGPKVTEYSYYANVAFVLCEGPIAGVRRIWADGRELDRTAVTLRIHRGTGDQLPDPLIAVKQGGGNAPAYRGTAYVVFERLPLADFGNRVPQMQFEVLRPVGSLRNKIRSVALIPGSTEYGLHPGLVTREVRPGETVAENRHVLHAGSDIAAALDELQTICPNVRDVAIVVSWFGTDLRAGACKIRPAVTTHAVDGLSRPWIVSGIDRAAADLVSTSGGHAAYGGTPSDRSVIEAINAVTARGLRVTLYPFVMMDIPAGNALPDPYDPGHGAQPAYPWRGRITCAPAPGVVGSADRTSMARAQIDVFCGTAAPGHFSPSGDTVSYSGPADDFGYRRFVLHYARLALMAGGVDTFLIGSELRGLTTLRDGADAFPFVEQLSALADEAKALLGPLASVTYGADWTEFFGHHPQDGSGDVYFHLDPLWARPSIAGVGIDAYMPISDWRDSDLAGDNPDGALGPYDPAALRAAVGRGEGYDWHYASPADRQARVRTTITDGAGKPWIYRYKDLIGWWSNAHYNRVAGVELPAPTAWVPAGKRIWFTEIGCPAIDKGPNQPNVFVDPKSSESFVPYFSDGGRNDLAQARYLTAQLDHWDTSSASFRQEDNPISPVYGLPMVDPERIYVWCWDARPFPAFPLAMNVWSDGGNWLLGHWLNGRLEGAEIGDLLAAILADYGLPAPDARFADGIVQGYVLDEPASARSALEPLVELFGLTVAETPTGLVARSQRNLAGHAVALEELAIEDGAPAVERVRAPDHELPAESVVVFRDLMTGFQSATVRAARLGAPARPTTTFGFPGVLDREQAQRLAADRLERLWSERDTVSFATTGYREATELGAELAVPGAPGRFVVTEIEDGLLRRIKARRVERSISGGWKPALPSTVSPPPVAAGRPQALFLDLPARTATADPAAQFRVAIRQKPWRSQAVLCSPATTGFEVRTMVDRPADIGRLVSPLTAGSVLGRLDRGSVLTVELFDGEAESVSRAALLNGANAAAIRTAASAWEILQYETAEEISPGIWRLGSLLRGQLGTDDAMRAGAPAGADFVVLDERVRPAGLLAAEIGLSLNWKVGPTGAEPSDERFASTTATGGLRARRPLSPVHLRCRSSGTDLVFSWVRRGRIDADGWDVAEIPLGEETEAYQIEIGEPGHPSVRATEVGATNWTYTAAQRAADFAVPPSALSATVRQFSTAAGWGLPAERTFTL